VGHPVWVLVPPDERLRIGEQCYKVLVLNFKAFLPAGPTENGTERKKHLVQIWTDPGGLRTLSVGSLHMKDPRKAAA
jgi:hypothetical protein